MARWWSFGLSSRLLPEGGGLRLKLLLEGGGGGKRNSDQRINPLARCETLSRC